MTTGDRQTFLPELAKRLGEAIKVRGVSCVVTRGRERHGTEHPRSFRVAIVQGDSPDGFTPAAVTGARVGRGRFYTKAAKIGLLISGRSNVAGARTEDHEDSVEMMSDLVLVELLGVCHGLGYAIDGASGGFTSLDPDAAPDLEFPNGDGAHYLLQATIARAVVGPENAVASGLIPIITVTPKKTVEV